MSGGIYLSYEPLLPDGHPFRPERAADGPLSFQGPGAFRRVPVIRSEPPAGDVRQDDSGGNRGVERLDRSGDRDAHPHRVAGDHPRGHHLAAQELGGDLVGGLHRVGGALDLRGTGALRETVRSTAGVMFIVGTAALFACAGQTPCLRVWNLPNGSKPCGC